jgi:hypothetical protein
MIITTRIGVIDVASDLKKQREYRRANGNAVTRRYERTKKGKLMRTYRNMQSRVLGILQKKAHLYRGLEILGREEFYDWALSSPEFHALYDGWVESGYRCGFSPSVDRIDPSKGYTLDNMEWVSHSENSRRASRARNLDPLNLPEVSVVGDSL